MVSRGSVPRLGYTGDVGRGDRWPRFAFGLVCILVWRTARTDCESTMSVRIEAILGIIQPIRDVSGYCMGWWKRLLCHRIISSGDCSTHFKMRYSSLGT